ncbi:hypothetical protein niasHT_014511 [Heterodera trifolii]|uniref:MATH domain-containing protein n=1 Tax=Heterodera trifolii TaxID=157864 RepID=A0ABD2KZH6_9BILA
MQFPTNGRISDRTNSKIMIDIENVSEFAREAVGNSRHSEKVYINGMPWKILAQIKTKMESTENNEKWLAIYLLYDGPKEGVNVKAKLCMSMECHGKYGHKSKKNESTDNNEKWLGIFLLCDAPKEDENWNCKCSAIIRIVSQKSGVSDFKREFDDHVFDYKMNSWGYNFISFSQLMDPEKGFYDQSENKVKLAIDITHVDDTPFNIKPCHAGEAMGIQLFEQEGFFDVLSTTLPTKTKPKRERPTVRAQLSESAPQ